MAAGGTATEARRPKAALFLLCCLAAGILPHRLAGLTSLVPSILLTLLLGGYGLRTVFLAPRRNPVPEPAPAADAALALELASAPELDPPAPPAVDLVVAARDEEAVIGRLVERLAQVRYPAGLLQIWVVDDGSEDRTPERLADLQLRYPQLQVLRRGREAGGGKSGALNAVLPRLQGRWLMVLDADAELQPEALERLVPYAEAGGWGAVQLRKAVVNAERNLLTRAQAMEMALDALIQQGRLAAGGVVELRGNGQLLRRDRVLACGGFNEATVTDDLDLSFRLLLDGTPVGIVWDPPVQEEAVTSLAALWRQRQRWAEGGLQRFFDYWPGLSGDRLSAGRKLDLACFFLLQYALPLLAVTDLIGAALTGTSPAIWPLSIVAFALSGGGIIQGCRRPSEGPALPSMGPVNLALGIVYLGHWFVVIPWTTLRMALLPKRLVWAKTLHVGDQDAEVPAATEAEEGDLRSQAS